MASKIKVDNITDQDDNPVISRCGSTHTVTAEVYKADTIKDTSGDTYLNKCGAILTIGAANSELRGIGTVNWSTAPQTGGFTASRGRGYFIDTSSGAVTVTLPASPNGRDIVSIKDYSGTFGTNNCTIARNGSNIRGEASDFLFEKNNSGGTFIYINATEGWQVFLDGSNSDAKPSRIEASGGTITTCGNFKIHTFTSPGTFCVSCSGCTGFNKVDYMIIAGGGGGGGSQRGGGGGAGGFREVRCTTTSGCWATSPLVGGNSVTVTAQGYPITVGGGGAAGGNTGVTRASSGSPSSGLGITSAGGGGGGGGSPGNASPDRIGLSGGSGGGGGSGSGDVRPGGSGNSPPVSPPQGKDGGTGNGGNNQSGGGGGGATVAGTASPQGPEDAAPGGTGATNSITGASVGRAGGGGGGKGTPASSAVPQGTQGGGGAGAAGVANKGGGGGGASSPGCAASGGAGGSGIVVIRYRFQ